MIHLLEHTFKDTINLLPFLFIAFLFIELLEHKFSDKTKSMINKSGKFGPVIGGLLGVFPQCGFSVIATNLYITRVISVGTLISIYLTTSDEMLPIMLSRKVDIKIIIIFILIKLICGIIFGLLIDLVLRNKKYVRKYEYNICEDDDCHCDHGLIKSVIKHTFNTFIFIFIVTLFLNFMFDKLNENIVHSIFMKDNIFGPFFGALIGLLPNCASSVILTELFLNNVINIGTCISGLLSCSGVALLILIKSNKNIKENIIIVSTLYFISVLIGIFLEILRIVLL